MRTIMYHYVREGDASMPYFRHLDFANFRRQLDFFESEYGFVERDEFDAFLAKGTMPKKAGKVLLTFDDGFSDHYDYVYPELMRRRLWGAFYVPASPYLDNAMLDVHRIHLLCGTVAGQDLVNATVALVHEDMMPDSRVSGFRNATYTKQNNIQGITEVKRILNYYIDYKYRNYVVSKLCDKYQIDSSVEKFYMDKGGMSQMESDGMIIGSHSVSHPVMSKLTREEQRAEIESSFGFLRSFLRLERSTYCHPYGGFHTFNGDTIDLLNDHGVEFSFNVESREIVRSDSVQSRQHLPRFDCNEFPFGQASGG
ncbi:MAG: polysaccharide deacetylase family protein [Rhodospirillales bacterium]|nr:polysaccharide deacetylase family protein [Rhodospirillales bacterium]